MKRLISALCGVGLAAAAIGIGGVATATVASAAPVCGALGYTGATPCLAPQAVPLALSGTHTLAVHGYGFHPGDVVVVTLCNSDATLPDPSYQFAVLHDLTPDACGAFGGPAFAQATVPATGKIVVALHVTPGQTGTNALSSCAESAVQVATGVNCVLGALDNTSTSAFYGQTASGGVFFAPPALMVGSDTYVAGSGDAAVYSASMTSSGEGLNSGLPPNGVAQTATTATADPQVPNNGSYATVGLVIQGAPGSPVTPPSGDAYVGGVLFNIASGAPATCQAASTPGATAWNGQQLCTYGATTGEPIFVAAKSWLAPVTVLPFAVPATQPTGPTSGGNPVPISTGTVLGVSLFPLDTCTVSASCPTGISVQANSGLATTNPGGFTASSSNVPALGGLDAGAWGFEAIGSSSNAKTTVVMHLPDANFGP